jgi:hypothetical protein
VFDGEQIVPFINARFPERGEVLEELVGVFDGFALVTDKCVELLCARCAL